MQIASINPSAAAQRPFAPPFAEDDDSLAASAALRIVESLATRASEVSQVAAGVSLVSQATQHAELASTLLRDDDQMGNDAMASLIDVALLPALRRSTVNGGLDADELHTALGSAGRIAAALELPFKSVQLNVVPPAE